MLNIKTYQDYEKFLTNKLDPHGVVFGIGVTAFMRFFPSLFVKNFKIITFKDSKDNPVLAKYADEIFVLKKRRPTVKLHFTNANNILRNKSVRNYILEHKGKKYLFLYKLNRNTEHAIKNLGVKVIANKSSLNKYFEDKVNFRKVLERINISPILGETMNFLDFQEKDYDYFKQKFGKKFVLQMPDFMLGGGKGTLFIEAQKKFAEFQEETEDGVYKKKVLTRINITKYIEGLSCSVACCATKHGTLISRVQRQILDVPQVISPKKGQGLFVGHVFGLKFNKKIIDQVHEISAKLGDYMYQKGFKGIFGIDLIIDIKANKVYPVECNARYTGAFPMISMLHMKYKIIPLDLFQFLEFLNIPYKINVKELNKMYQKKISGSHIILSNTRSYGIEVKKEIEVGCYRYNTKTKKIDYKNDAFFYEALKTSNDLILVDGVPKKGQIIKKYSRIARIVHVLFNDDIVKNNGQLKDKYLQIVYSIYKSMFNKKQP